MELSEVRARVSRARERPDRGSASGGDGPASSRPRCEEMCEERRRERRVALDRGRSWWCGRVSGTLLSATSSGWVSLAGCGEPRKPGAHDSGREERLRRCASDALLECACPMV